jgi:2-C-methyl-D-erythritol 2,4-cyclodiphosphate synthase
MAQGMQYRIGMGYDIHRLVEDKSLILGGVEIPYSKGLLGHSDADVLLHSICDALLGASGLGDIGELFPDTDSRYKGISSVKLLKRVTGLIKAKGYSVSNIDSIIIAEEPKPLPFKEKMRHNIANILGVKKDVIKIKVKTNEGLGEIGEKKAMASYAVALLKNKGD